MQLWKDFALRLFAIGTIFSILGSSSHGQEVEQIRFRFPGDENNHHRLSSQAISAVPPYNYNNHHLVRARVTRTDGVPLNWIHRKVYKKVPNAIAGMLCERHARGLRGTLSRLTQNSDSHSMKLVENFAPLGACNWVLDEILDPLIKRQTDSDAYEGRCGVGMIINELAPSDENPTLPLPSWWVGIPILSHNRELMDRGYEYSDTLGQFKLSNASRDGSLAEEVLPTSGPWLHMRIVNGSTFEHFSSETSACHSANLSLDFESVPVCDAILSTYSQRNVKCTGSTDQMMYMHTLEFPKLPSYWTNKLVKGDACTLMQENDDIGSYMWTWTYISPNEFHVSTSSNKVLDPSRCRVN